MAALASRFPSVTSDGWPTGIDCLRAVLELSECSLSLATGVSQMMLRSRHLSIASIGGQASSIVGRGITVCAGKTSEGTETIIHQLTRQKSDCV